MKNNNLKIRETVFISITHDSSGGVVCVANDAITLSISFTIFRMCSIPNTKGLCGGCIFFNSSRGSFVGTKICASDCSAYFGLLMYSILSSSSNNENKITLSSMHQCANSSSLASYDVIRLDYGVCEPKHLNHTNSIVNSDTIFGISHGTNNKCSFCSFLNNTADPIFSYWTPLGESILTKSIFIASHSKNSRYSLFYYTNPSTSYNARVSECYFFENFDPVFNYINSMIIISNCTMDKYSYNTQNTPLETINIMITSTSCSIPTIIICTEIRNNIICTRKYNRANNIVRFCYYMIMLFV